MRTRWMWLFAAVFVLALAYGRQTRSSAGEVCNVCFVPPVFAEARPAPLRPNPPKPNAAAAPNAGRPDPVELKRNARAEEMREHGVCFPLFKRGDAARKEVALTFDDGPHPKWTPQLLDLLRSLHVRATFFLVGKMVDAHPELAAREVAEGHEVANHTYTHRGLTTLTEPEIEQELREGAAAIRRAVGYAPMFFRPPGGDYDANALRAAAALHMTPVLWTANSKDFLYPAPGLVEKRLMTGTLGGGILLCHDGIPQTMQVLPDLVARLRAQGYTFVTVSELADHLAASEHHGATRPELPSH